METVTIEEFEIWKNHPVSKFLKVYLKENVKLHESHMLSRDTLSKPEGILRLNYLRGYVDAINDILNINPIEESEE